MARRSPKVALPGEMYQKNGRWWWKVRLPGEPRVRARALKPNGAQVAAKTRKVAEEVACEKWRLSIEAETEARVKAEVRARSGHAVAKVKAKAADAIAKVEAECNEQLEACAQALAKAQEKARAEAAGRVAAEAKLGAQPEHAGAQFEQREKAYGDALSEAQQKAQAEASLRAEVEQRARSQGEALVQGEARARAEATLRAEAELRSEAEQRANSQAKARIEIGAGYGRAAESAGRSGPCEGCGQQDVPEHELAKIDSGQLVCPDCLTLIRA